MRILVVQETDWITRYPHTQHHLFERLSLKGHSIQVIDNGFDWKRDPKWKLFQKRENFLQVSKIYDGAGIDVIRPSSLHIPVLEYGYLIYSHYLEISRQIRRFKPDIIIGFGILNTYLASILARQYDIPFLYYWIDALDTLIPEIRFQKIGRYIERKTIKNSRSLFVTNEKLKDHLIELGAKSGNIDIFSSGVDFTQFHKQIDGKEIREIFNIREDKIVLFFMGWIYHFSGLKEIAIQLAHEREKYDSFVLLVVGEGDAYPDMVRIKEDKQLGDHLILAGRQPYEDIPKFIAAADICILPAYQDEKIMQDIIPIKILEYMAGGKPVLCTRLPGILKEFGEEKGVMYCNNPEEVLPTLYALHIEGNFHEWTFSSREFVQHFDWKQITDRFEKRLNDFKF